VVTIVIQPPVRSTTHHRTVKTPGKRWFITAFSSVCRQETWVFSGLDYVCDLASMPMMLGGCSKM
jgi:hypothetical protein